MSALFCTCGHPDNGGTIPDDCPMHGDGEPIAIKPCPHCGSAGRLRDMVSGNRVCCVSGLCGMYGPYATNPDAAIAAWNTRIPTDQLEGLVADLRKRVQSLIDDCEADYPPSHGALKYGLKDILAKLPVQP